TMSNTISKIIVPLGKQLKIEKLMIIILSNSVKKMVSVKYFLFARNLNDYINFLSEIYKYTKSNLRLVQVKEGLSISRQEIYKVVLEI
ncbi:10098_t:CDS:1, partial [Scutellospora calospora]